MSKIFKRGDVWWIDYRYKGKRVRRSLTTMSKKLAVLAQKNLDVQKAKEELNLSTPKKISFEKFCERFLSWYEVQNSKKSFKDYENLFNSTIIPHFKGYSLNKINVEMIEKYKIKRSERIKPATVNKELTALKHIFNKAIQWGYQKENPVTQVKKLKVIEKKFRFLSLDEIDLVLENSPDSIYPILLTAIHTGLRKSELFRLEWNDIDFEREVITVTAKGEEHTKNYRNREIPMTDQLIECLITLPRKSNWIFTKEDGERYVGWIRSSLKLTIQKARIERFTLHDLRHTFASQLVMEGADLPAVQKLMGHSKITTTMIYAHLAPDHLKGTIKRLSSRLKKGTNWAQRQKINQSASILNI
jgi:integrase